MESGSKRDTGAEIAPVTMEEQHAFSSTWLDLTRNLNVSPDRAQKVLQLLIKHHSEPHRRYHTAAHVSALIHHLHSLNSATPTALLAAFFHDAVYDATRTDNELQSAALASRTLRGLSSPAVDMLVADVERIILATATHKLPDDAPKETAAILDADLAILASENYKQYAAAIEYEYKHLDKNVFREGRAAVLEGLLARETLFFTTDGRARFEEDARANVEAEIRRLREG